MPGLKIGIDFGSTSFTVFVEGRGIVMCEPSVCVVDKYSGKTLAVGKEAKDIKVIFAGDATQVCNTLCEMTTKMGMNFVHYGPANHKISDEWLGIGQKNVEKYGIIIYDGGR